MADIQFHRENHYLPRSYLKSWAGSDGKVSAYSLLVPHSRVPLWKRRSPRGLASHAHLYTRTIAGRESDEIERWFDREFETPAAEALRKATADERLTADDWRLLVRFLAAQDVRTPAWFVRQMKRWKETFPDLLEGVLYDVVRKAEAGTLPSAADSVATNYTDENLPLRSMMVRPHDDEEGKIGAAILAGRKLWLYSVRLALTKTLSALHEHRWTILAPPKGTLWFTSDAPVLKLNYASQTDYDFGGGWGSRRTEIYFPLGPRHLMYTQIGQRPPRRGEKMDASWAALVRRYMAEHAYRYVIAREPDAEVQRLRPRVEDAVMFQQEREQWERWHEEQVEAETDFDSAEIE